MRQIWIIKQKPKVEDADIAEAEAHGCAEIANGIPPALKGKVKGKDLPLVYTEPASPPPIDWQAEWKKVNTLPELKAFLAKRLGLE